MEKILDRRTAGKTAEQNISGLAGRSLKEKTPIANLPLRAGDNKDDLLKAVQERFYRIAEVVFP